MASVIKHINHAMQALLTAEGAPLLRNWKMFLEMFEAIGDFQRAYDQYYPDEDSRKILGWVLEARTVMAFFGQGAIPYFNLESRPYSPGEWKKLEEKAQHLETGIDDDYLLDRIDTWLLESYSLKGRCEALPGDIVLDCGTFTGSTSKYFSQKVGPTGHVYGFEAGSTTFARYRRNMKAFPNVTPVHAAVFDHSGTITFRFDNSAGGQITGEISAISQEEPAISLDDFVKEHGLEKVDFIKMDVEGAEKNALRGAADLLARFRPRMALSAYHITDDLFTLPDLLEELVPGVYSYALRHFSDTIYETVLYCIPNCPNRTQKAGNSFRPEDQKEFMGIINALVHILSNSIDYLTNGENKVDAAVVDLMRANLQDANRLMSTLLEKNHELQEQNNELQRENLALRRIAAKRGS